MANSPKATRSIPNRIRELREANGITQQDLANQLGVSQSQIDRLEKGQRRLSQEWIFRFAKAFSVDPQVIMWDRGSYAGYMITESSGLRDEGRATREKKIPIYRTMKGRVADHFVLTQRIESYAIRPAGLIGVDYVEAFRVPNDTMSPRWKKGEIVFFNPDLKPLDGEHVLIMGPQPVSGTAVVTMAQIMFVEGGEGALNFYNPGDSLKDYAPDMGIEKIQRLNDADWWCRIYEWEELITPAPR